MIKIFNVLLMGVFLLPGLVFGQVMECTTIDGLAWDMNEEPDMKEYVVYFGSNPITEPDQNLNKIIVAHDLENVKVDESGKKYIEHILEITLPNGNTYFRAIAKDQAGNESGLSNEVFCFMPDIAPGEIILRFRFK